MFVCLFRVLVESSAGIRGSCRVLASIVEGILRKTLPQQRDFQQLLCQQLFLNSSFQCLWIRVLIYWLSGVGIGMKRALIKPLNLFLKSYYYIFCPEIARIIMIFGPMIFLWFPYDFLESLSRNPFSHVKSLHHFPGTFSGTISNYRKIIGTYAKL